MKIGFDAQKAYSNNTGLGHYSREIIRILSEYYPENEYHLYSPCKTTVDYKPKGRNIIEQMPPLKYSALACAFWRQLLLSNKISDNNIDIYVGLDNELPIGIAAKKVKAVVVIHDLIFMRFPEFYSSIERQIKLLKAKRACKSADLIIAASEQTKKDIIDFLNVEESKVKVVYQGCRKEFKQEYSDDEKNEVIIKYKLPKRFILNVSRIEENKNQLNILQAIADLKEIHLVLVGDEYAYSKKLREFIEKENMQDRVLFLKNVNSKDLAIIYQLADIFVYPSLFEGFGIPIIEALYSKTAVITSTDSCFSEAGGKYTWYVNPNDSSELKLALVELWNSPESREQIAELSHKYVQKFNDEEIAKSFMESILS